MNEPDDRLAGDPVWELFPAAPTEQEPASRFLWLWLAALAATAWLVWPPLSVILACLAAAVQDLRAGYAAGRSVPDKAGGRVCALFAYAWGVWKAGLTAFALLFAAALVTAYPEHRDSLVATSLTAGFLWLTGMTASAGMTAAGMWMAYRAGMKVWIGEGINQARTLLLGMLLVGFVYFVLIPLCLMLTGVGERPGDTGPGGRVLLLIVMGSMFAGPVAILVVLDLVCKHIVADQPARFGPKVPTVGKWGP